MDFNTRSPSRDASPGCTRSTPSRSRSRSRERGRAGRDASPDPSTTDADKVAADATRTRFDEAMQGGVGAAIALLAEHPLETRKGWNPVSEEALVVAAKYVERLPQARKYFFAVIERICTPIDAEAGDEWPEAFKWLTPKLYKTIGGVWRSCGIRTREKFGRIVISAVLEAKSSHICVGVPPLHPGTNSAVRALLDCISA